MARGGYNYLLCGDMSFQPWTISPGKGDRATDKSFLVEPGVCFSRYSLDTGSFVPIQGLNQDFDNVKENDKFFIQFNLLSNLQVSGAQIKCEPIGDDAPEGGWKSYPEFYEITPQDEFDPDTGRVKKIRDGKRQTKCFALIGYQTDDTHKNSSKKSNSSSSSSQGSSSTSNDPNGSSSSSKKTIDWVQILDQNLILAATIVSGIPCVIPFPYLNAGYNHLASLVDIDEFKGDVNVSSTVANTV